MVWKLLVALALLAGACGDDEPSLPRAARVYATVSKDAEVLVIDEASHDVLKKIPVGMGPAIIIKTPDHKKLFTANWGDKTVSIIDTRNDTAKTLQMPGRPYVIAMAPDGKNVYVGLDTVNEIALIDTSTDAIARSIKFSELPASIIASPDNQTLYVATLGLGITNGGLVGVQIADGSKPWPSVTVGRSPAWITIARDGQKVYTLNFLSDTVSVVDIHSWKVTATVDTGVGSQGIIGNVTPDGKQLWVTNHGTNEVIAIDTASNTVVKRIPLAARPVGVEFNADGSRVYITDFGPDSVNEPVRASYLLTGIYDGTTPGQVRAFDTTSGAQVGPTVVTGPGATSVVVVPADE
ncbi:MAG: YncE family protein [Polyangiales bacterium]